MTQTHEEIAHAQRMSPARRLSEDERLDWLRLIRSENVGPATFHELLAHFGNAGAALQALPDLARQGGARRTLRICSLRDAEQELKAARRLGAQIAALGEPEYPLLLGEITAPPPLLYLKGIPALARRACIAIVGSRNASAAGRKLAAQIAQGLGQAGVTVISGLARGIDAAAHEGALKTGTAAVLAGGIDVIYPPENEPLHREVERRGLLVAEARPGLKPRGVDFPRRNRIISGLSLAVIVVEAARGSGSMLTARHAADQGREVMAVPGHPLDPRAAGPNRLLKDGAALITCAQDVLDAISPALRQLAVPGAPSGEPRSFEEPDVPPPRAITARMREQVIEALGPGAVPVDDVIRATGLEARIVRAVLLELDLAGRLERERRDMVALRPQG